MAANFSEQLARAARELRDAVNALRFPPPVACVYNPLDYAWPAHAAYLRRFGNSRKRAVLLGMNPGPFGMAQTGVPFGEVAAVRDWLRIGEKIGRPPREHPKRPVAGFACQRSEVSGRRLWGLFAQRFGTPENFFEDHFVVNWCPLVFMDEGGRNLTPDKLPAAAAASLSEKCDEHLTRVLEILEPEFAIGIGGFAFVRLGAVERNARVKLGQILHPSPASPAANRDWAGQVTRQLIALGVWP
ncbi:MAG: single-stranded DNA-binding protein [Verrucomicrobia bacterium]|nr:single-stranded DNA-binding protein [Verrucomicrobiota bacterium]